MYEESLHALTHVRLGHYNDNNVATLLGSSATALLILVEFGGGLVINFDLTFINCYN